MIRQIRIFNNPNEKLGKIVIDTNKVSEFWANVEDITLCSGEFYGYVKSEKQHSLNFKGFCFPGNKATGCRKSKCLDKDCYSCKHSIEKDPVQIYLPKGEWIPYNKEEDQSLQNITMIRKGSGDYVTNPRSIFRKPVKKKVVFKK